MGHSSLADAPHAATATVTKVRVTGLVKHFPGPGGGVTAIDGLDLAIADGEMLALVGPSGCGKSTFLRVLAGLERPDSGSVAVLDRQARLATATVFQGVSLFPWYSAVQNAAYPLAVAGAGRKERGRAAAAMLERLGLGGFLRAYPAQLSEGMRQRVALARALLTDADVLLMDEPFSALDEPTRLLLQEELQDLLAQSRRTAIVVTHSIDEAVLLADRVVVLSARPARVLREVPVAFERPRRYGDLRADPRFNTLTVAIWETLRAEVVRAGGG